MAKNITQNGLKIKNPEAFYEEYDSSKKILYYGSNNTYSNNLRSYYQTSPSFYLVANRKRDALIGLTDTENIKCITGKISKENILEDLILDYCIFGGYAVKVTRDETIGDIIGVSYIPFEQVRLGEKGESGFISKAFINPDWTFYGTLNKRRISEKNTKAYWIFVNEETSRMRAFRGETEEIYFYSNRSGRYPIPEANAVLSEFETEIACQEVMYRNSATGFFIGGIVATSNMSKEDSEEFEANLLRAQGSNNAGKLLHVNYSGETPAQILPFQANNFDDALEGTYEKVRKDIYRVFKQGRFRAIEDGEDGNADLSKTYKMYTFEMRTERKKLENSLHIIYPELQLLENDYSELGDTQNVTVNQ